MPVTYTHEGRITQRIAIEPEPGTKRLVSRPDHMRIGYDFDEDGEGGIYELPATYTDAVYVSGSAHDDCVILAVHNGDSKDIRLEPQDAYDYAKWIMEKAVERGATPS